MRVATIDIGTNTVLLLVAERDDRGGELVAVEERATITRLGQGVDKTRTLAPDAIARTTAALDDYATAIRRAGATRVDVVGTSAMRDAAGGEKIREHVRRVLDVDARVIGGDEEARLTFLGALAGIADGPSQGVANATVFDIGGGSTEIVRGRRSRDGTSAELAFARSYDVGSVRMTERHIAHDPPSETELDALTRDVERVVETLPPVDAGEIPVGIAGTVTTLAAVALDMVPYDGARVHGHVIEVAELERVVARLARLSLAERRTVRGLEPKRADVIVGGGLVALTLLRRWGSSRVRISDRGVRWGLALALCK